MNKLICLIVLLGSLSSFAKEFQLEIPQETYIKKANICILDKAQELAKQIFGNGDYTKIIKGRLNDRVEIKFKNKDKKQAGVVEFSAYKYRNIFSVQIPKRKLKNFKDNPFITQRFTWLTFSSISRYSMEQKCKTTDKSYDSLGNLIQSKRICHNEVTITSPDSYRGRIKNYRTGRSVDLEFDNQDLVNCFVQANSK